MADEADMAEEAPLRRSRWRTAAQWTGIVLAGLVLLIVLVLVGINTDAGRRYVVDQINHLEMASGLDIDIGRIEGSLYGELTLHDLTLKDTRGTFFVAPVVELDWRPFAYLRNHIDIKSLEIPRARLMRLPALNPGDPNAPLLPDIDIDVGHLEVGRLRIDPAVTGRRHILTLSGGDRIADGRAQITADARTLSAEGMAGGDRLVLRLDAVPEENRFDVDARLQAPANGFVAGLAGLDRAEHRPARETPRRAAQRQQADQVAAIADRKDPDVGAGGKSVGQRRGETEALHRHRRRDLQPLPGMKQGRLVPEAGEGQHRRGRPHLAQVRARRGVRPGPGRRPLVANRNDLNAQSLPCVCPRESGGG
jgi:hypothetical protein